MQQANNNAYCHSLVKNISNNQFLTANSYTHRLETRHVPVVTENLALVVGMAQVEIDQFLDPALPELLVKRNFKIHPSVLYLLDIGEPPGMVSIFHHIVTIFITLLSLSAFTRLSE